MKSGWCYMKNLTNVRSWLVRRTWQFIFLLSLACAASAVANVNRIATVAPSLTELVYAAGAGNKLVAVSAHSDYPIQAASLPQVADYNGINLEALLARRPDLVFVWTSGTRQTDIQRLTKLGIPVEAIGVKQLSDVPKALRRIGQIAGTELESEKAALAFEARLAALRAKYQSQKTISAFFEISRQPLMTIGGTHFISEVMALCGAKNSFAAIELPAFTPSRESLLVKNPRIIFYSANSQKVSATKPVSVRDNSVYAGLSAKSRENIFALDADHILRPGPRLLDAAEAMCRRVDEVRRD